jgi:hypothetical protein
MLINLIGFQICWFGLIYWGNSFAPIALLLITIHLFFLSNKRQEFMLVLYVTIIGCSVDIILTFTGIFVFQYSSLIPLWLIVLWGCFSSTIAHSLQFLKSSTLIQGLVGALIAPLSYIAGYKFGAVDFTYSVLTTYLVLSITWSLLMVIFFKLNTVLIRNKYA